MKAQKINLEENRLSALPRQTRRSFLRTSALSMAAASLASSIGKAQNAPIEAPYVGKVKGANDMINVACIGVGGQGASDTNDVLGFKGKGVKLVAL